MGLTRTAVLGDIHGPWHCEDTLDLVLDVLDDIQIDRIILNGDVLDFYNVNSHGPKHPEIMTTLEDELVWGKEFLESLSKRFQGIEIIFVFGNHEDRLDRFIVDKCPKFWNFLKLEKFLELGKLKMKWHPYNSAIQIEKSNMWVQHSPPSYGVSGTRTSLLKKLDTSFIWNCTHRMQHSCLTGHTGHVYHAYFNGWLGSTRATKEHQRVFSYAKGHENWQHCFSLVTVESGKYAHVQQVPIVNKSCVVDGTLYGI